jgi:hypothetical protein
MVLVTVTQDGPESAANPSLVLMNVQVVVNAQMELALVNMDLVGLIVVKDLLIMVKYFQTGLLFVIKDGTGPYVTNANVLIVVIREIVSMAFAIVSQDTLVLIVI